MEMLWYGLLGVALLVGGFYLIRLAVRGITGSAEKLRDIFGSLGQEKPGLVRVLCWWAILPGVAMIGGGVYCLMPEIKDHLKSNKTWAEGQTKDLMLKDMAITVDKVELNDMGDSRYVGTASRGDSKWHVEATVTDYRPVYRRIKLSYREIDKK
jgi:hypothetical protein